MHAYEGRRQCLAGLRRGRWAQMGLDGLLRVRLAGADSAQIDRIGFVGFFSEFFSAKQISKKNLENVQKHEKHPENPKNLGKFPER
jgi:hypothetical protein